MGQGGADDAGKGPYGTVLHTACAIGNPLLVELQIKANVNVDALDDHGWTAYMVATAQGNSKCAELLAAHVELTTGLSPSGLVSSTSEPTLTFRPDQFTAVIKTEDLFSVMDGLQIRSNHPIPPDSETFYYEINIENIGPLGYKDSNVMN